MQLTVNGNAHLEKMYVNEAHDLFNRRVSHPVNARIIFVTLLGNSQLTLV